MSGKILLEQVFTETIKTILPHNLISKNIRLCGQKLWVQKQKYSVPDKLYVFGSGKASLAMAKEIENIFVHCIKGGTIVCNYNDNSLEKTNVIESAHPIPDNSSLSAGASICAQLSSLGKEDFFIFLLSGGSSSLLEKLAPGISLEDLQIITRMLLQSGASIDEINTIRKHISLIKGGQLAHATKAKGVVLVLSDVIGDCLETIGSGLLYCDSTTFYDAITILKKRNLYGQVPYSISKWFKENLEKNTDTPKYPNDNVHNIVIGSNQIALREAQNLFKQKNISAFIITSQLCGEAKEVAKVIIAIAKEIKDTHNPFKPPVCLIFGGETTVNVSGKGKGGRNQELCLAALKEIKNMKGIYLLSAGTDGIDGNSDAAGAVVSSHIYQCCQDFEEVDEYLQNNDSHSFFKKYGGLLYTGKTGTNMMDIVLLFVE